jgi:VanZ family protein
MMSKYSSWIPAVLFMVFLFWLSSRPVPEGVRWLPVIAGLKVSHMIEYGILFLLVRYGLIRTTAYDKPSIFALALMTTILYGLTDEFHQIFVVSRSARLIDVVADGVGGILAQACISVSSNLKK